MSRWAASLVGALILAIMAAGLAEVTLAVGQRGSLSNDTDSQPIAGMASPSHQPTPRVTPSATPSPTPTPSPSASSAPTATTNAFVHLRAQPSTSSQILVSLNGDTVVQLLSGGNADWQEVEYHGLTGYIFTSYLSY